MQALHLESPERGRFLYHVYCLHYPIPQPFPAWDSRAPTHVPTSFLYLNQHHLLWCPLFYWLLLTVGGIQASGDTPSLSSLLSTGGGAGKWNYLREQDEGEAALSNLLQHDSISKPLRPFTHGSFIHPFIQQIVTKHLLDVKYSPRYWSPLKK